MSTSTRKALDAAIAEGMLPPQAGSDTADTHPWPVILLTALGAWLAAIPILGAIGMILDDLLSKDLGPYLLGVPILIAAVAVLRARQLPLFIEQLAIPALLVALGSIAFGLSRHLGEATASALLGALAIALAALLPRGWLRALLGFAAATLLIWSLSLGLLSHHGVWRSNATSRLWLWIALHLALAAWVGALLVQGALGARCPRAAAGLEAVATGWVIACVTGLCWLSGMTLLVGAALDPMLRDAAGEIAAHNREIAALPWLGSASSLIVIGASLWAARPWVLGVTAGIAVLAWMLPTLGGVWAVMVIALVTRRGWLAAFAALGLAWIIGAFYYQLQWSLAQKALALGSVGLVLGVLAWLGTGRAGTTEKASNARRWGLHPDRGTLLIALTTLATLATANLQIWTKERLIAEGRTVYVKLIPVDPRSLMQGDFMRLRFPVPGAVDGAIPHLSLAHPQVVARCDDRGVATLLRIHAPEVPLAEGELLMNLTPKDGRWTLGSDAWFFREGDAERWEAARYGEFRVKPDGDLLLVGMADGTLRPILTESSESGSAEPDQ